MSATPHSGLLHRLREIEEHQKAGNYYAVERLLSSWSEDDLLAIPQVACYLADAWCRTGRAQEALELLARVELRIGWQKGTAAHLALLNTRGVAHFHLAQMEAAETAWRESLVAAEAAEDLGFTALAYNNLGTIADLQCRFEEAIASYERAAVFFQRRGRWAGMGWVHGNLALSYLQLGRVTEAEQHTERAIQYHDAAGNRTFRWLVELTRARIACIRGDLRLGEAMLERVRTIFDSLGLRNRVAATQKYLAGVRATEGRYPEAHALLEEALAAVRATADRREEAEIHRERALVHARQGSAEACQRALIEARALYQMLGASARAERLRREIRELGVELEE